MPQTFEFESFHVDDVVAFKQPVRVGMRKQRQMGGVGKHFSTIFTIGDVEDGSSQQIVDGDTHALGPRFLLFPELYGIVYESHDAVEEWHREARAFHRCGFVAKDEDAREHKCRPKREKSRRGLYGGWRYVGFAT